MAANIRKRSTTIYLDEHQHQQLKLLSEKTKVPFAEYVRQGIDMLLRQLNPQPHQSKSKK